ncbi:MAG: FtsX-like permease family protein [Myxococcales bacterium]|nr:FtsX-like permease family protein [Myxococcales bacterium]MCB9714828.1 FtsX-like permease family protein [Myxococcales bacterium]
MSPILRKLLRDLARLQGQVITIALVVACGIASFVTMRSNYDSLLSSRDTYYEEFRFGDVFAHLERAPVAVEDQLEEVPGVAQAYTRVVESVMVPMPQMLRPASGTLVSLPPGGEPPLHAVFIEEGRALDPDRSDEVILLESFAKAHGLRPGDSVPAVINGTMRELTIVGIGMSPEFVMVMPAGSMTFDPKQVAVLWMNRDVVEAAFQMEGGFNDVVARLQPGADETTVLAAIDRVLEPYGGVGALGRAKQPSHYMLAAELQQLESMATVVPFIFLFVAAFLLNVVLSRLVTLQRPQIATLKALGYGDREVGLHYLMLVSVIVVLGALLGMAVGAYLGRQMLGLYTDEYFRFPYPRYFIGLDVAVTGVGVSLGAAVVGALAAVRRVSRLPPAEAMRPPAPASYRRTLIERIGLFSWLSPASRMIVRELQRQPLRVLLSATGIALSIAIVVTSRFTFDAMSYMMDVQVHQAMREDISVILAKPLPQRAVRELEHLPGVFRAEGIRSVAVRFHAGHRWRDASILGYPPDGELRHLVDREGHLQPVPQDGELVITSKLGELLGVRAGETIEVELREGDRETREVVVTGFVDESFGLQGHMRKDSLHALLREAPSVSSVLLDVDPLEFDAITQRLKELPWVLSVSSPRDFRENFEEQSGEMMGVFTFILTTFASIIAVGVIYNNTRVALSQRSRDFASLRVLGFTRREIAAILLGEQAIQVALAIPLGLLLGHAMAVGIMSSVDPETYRFPVIISARTYIYSSMVALAAALVSALLVRRKLDRLDLIGVLKTRE